MFDRKDKEVPLVREPNLETKPNDFIGFCFGFVCKEHHRVNETLDVITVESLTAMRVCQSCGNVTRLATVKRTAEPRWENLYVGFGLEPCWGWTHNFTGLFISVDVMWTRAEFITFLTGV